MSKDVIVKISNKEKTLCQKYLCLDDELALSHDSEKMKKYVEKAMAEFKGDAKKIDVTVKMKW